MKNVLVINGPNLNLLGTREPEIYGSTTLNELDTLVTDHGANLGIAVSCFQSNHEGEIIDRLHAGRQAHDGVIINAGALTHYSYALHDAIVAIGLPTVEVHISNVKAREPWRRSSVIGPACRYAIYGRGIDGYRHALDYLANHAASQPLTVSYGHGDDQIGDLRVPEGAGPHPVAVLIHGGFWRDHWTRDLMDGLAIDLTGRGWATWNLEYHRVGSGGGWPLTLEDVATGIDHLGDLATDHALDLATVVTIGHSAGGHLALWAAARPHLSDHIPDLDTGVPLQAAIGLAAVSDLEAGFTADLGDGAVEAFIRRTPANGADRFAAASPRDLLPMGIRQVLVHGTNDDAVPVAMSRDYAAAATAGGDAVTYHEIDDATHMDMIDPAHPAWAAVTAELDTIRGT
jgi:3-dehydroquinate dehydratase type II